MKKRSGIFSLTKKENEAINSNLDYIGVVSCLTNGDSCKEHLLIINESLLTSKKHHIDKNYPLVFDEIRIAFNKATELTQSPCDKCAAFYRSTIIKSTKNIHDELQQMQAGFFGKKHKASFKLAQVVLDELKAEDQNIQDSRPATTA